jgi:hypothetical protein
MVRAENSDHEKGLVVVGPRIIGKTSYTLWRLLKRLQESPPHAQVTYFAPTQETGVARDYLRDNALGIDGIHAIGSRYVLLTGDRIMHILPSNASLPNYVEQEEIAIDEAGFCNSMAMDQAQERAKQIFVVGTMRYVDRRPGSFERWYRRSLPGKYYMPGWRSFATGPSPLLSDEQRASQEVAMTPEMFAQEHGGGEFPPLEE